MPGRAMGIGQLDSWTVGRLDTSGVTVRVTVSVLVRVPARVPGRVTGKGQHQGGWMVCCKDLGDGERPGGWRR